MLIDDHADRLGVSLGVLTRSITAGSVHPTNFLMNQTPLPDSP
ncbi:hypothetical protein [Rhodococcus koreensis]